MSGSYKEDKFAIESPSSSQSRSPSVVDVEAHLGFDDKYASINRKKLLRKMDWHILPYVMLTYMVVRLDLNNINNAGTLNKETGHSLKQVLNLNAKQWANVIMVFYFPYMVSEPLCTPLVKKTSPSIWLTRIMVSWGAVMTCMAAVTNYGGLLTCRVLLGLFEGSYFTSIVYHWSFWYTPAEMAPRILYLYVANSSSGGFSGLLAYGISFTNGKLYGWQWLFIIEGLITVFLGVGMWFILPDWPSTSKWLTPLEQEYIVAHLHKDAPKTTDKTWDWPQIKRMLADPTFFTFTLFWMCWSVSAWGASTMQTFLLLDLGLSGSAVTQLLQIPPAATGVMMCIISAYLIRQRKVSPFIVTLMIVGGTLIAFVVLLKAPQAVVRFLALCVITGSAPSAYACLWPRRVASLRGTSATAFGIGLLNAVSQFSGVLGPQLWRTDFGPRYLNSSKAACAFVSMAFLVVLTTWYLMEGDLSWSPWLKRHVLAQTQITADDEEAAKRGERVGTGEKN
ncbi:hypothetical protein JCM8547_000613 [Rhodosporidiobolus lusitaniae]